MIYLDYSATTPVDSKVLDTYVKVTERYIGNPNSLHKLGVLSKGLIDASTEQIKDLLKIKDYDVIYTSGASEANNLAIKGICFKYQSRGKHIITTKLEHSSVSEPIKYLESLGFEVSYVKLDNHGLVDLNDLEKLMRDDTILVSIVAVNSEIGLLQPLDKISEIVKKYPKCYFHSDVTQAIGKVNIDLSVLDLASFSAQKFYGMKGIGCLIKKENIVIEPLIHGGKSTTIYRSGTPAVSLIASLAKALRLANDNFSEKFEHVLSLNKYLVSKLKILDVLINSNDYCIPHIVNVSLNNIKAETMLHALEQNDIYISTQTACSDGNYSASIMAFYDDLERASHSIRISLSYLTTKDDIDKFVEIFDKCINELTF